MLQALFDDKQVRDFIKLVSKNIDEIKGRVPKYVGLLSALVFKDVMDHFQKEAGPEGSWKDWSDIYAAHMVKIGRGGNKLLQYYGRTRNSFMPTNYRKHSQGIMWFNNAQTSKGFPYAQAHNEGGRTSGRPPQREFMWLSDKAMDDISEQTLAFLVSDK